MNEYFIRRMIYCTGSHKHQGLIQFSGGALLAYHVDGVLNLLLRSYPASSSTDYIV
ncbi:hypothetical protein BDR06DRAFT_959030 [Suillus hirtellus]|nr:hypothetical protein BDR06DRAFT_959030 [Suillus hirtellus]